MFTKDVFMRFSRWLITVLLIAITAAACTPAATPVPIAVLPDPADVLSKASQTILATKFVKIKLQLSGAPAFVDTTNRISFVSADAQYLAPDRVGAQVTAKVLGVAGEVDVIAIGDDQWYKNSILTGGQYINAVFSPGFNAQKLVSSDTGIQSALKLIKDLKMIGRETTRNGANVYHITGTADGKDIESLTVGLIRGKVVNVDIYVNVDNMRAEEVILLQPDTVTASEPKPTRWDLELYDYDVPVTVTAPNVPTRAAAPGTTVQSLGQGLTIGGTQAATQAMTQTAVPSATQTLTPQATITGTLPTATIPLPTDLPTATLPISLLPVGGRS